VALEADATRARERGRAYLARYLPLTNYTRPLRELDYGDEDLADGGSDRLVDALVGWGDERAVARRVEEHREAGADHVGVQVVGTDLAGAIDELERLAPHLCD
jgi:hypothetical protein